MVIETFFVVVSSFPPCWRLSLFRSFLLPPQNVFSSYHLITLPSYHLTVLELVVVLPLRLLTYTISSVSARTTGTREF